MPRATTLALVATLLSTPFAPAIAQSSSSSPTVPDLPPETPAPPSPSASQSANSQARAAQAEAHPEAEPTSQAAAKGYWQPVSTSARGVTGAVSLSGKAVSINLHSFPLLAARPLNPSEVNSIFNPDTPSPTGGYLYRLAVPAAQQFVKHNTLCGSDDVSWLVTFVQGRTLQLAFFSGSKAPTFTAEAMANTTALCGTYTYTK